MFHNRQDFKIEKSPETFHNRHANQKSIQPKIRVHVSRDSNLNRHATTLGACLEEKNAKRRIKKTQQRGIGLMGKTEEQKNTRRCRYRCLERRNLEWQNQINYINNKTSLDSDVPKVANVQQCGCLVLREGRENLSSDWIFVFL